MKKLATILFLGFFTMTLFAQTTLDTAINFTVKDVEGHTFNLYDKLDENKIVVIDFFSTA